MAFDPNFGYSFPFFSSLLKEEKKKRRMNSKNRYQKSWLSARSCELHSVGIINIKSNYKQAFGIIIHKVV